METRIEPTAPYSDNTIRDFAYDKMERDVTGDRVVVDFQAPVRRYRDYTEVPAWIIVLDDELKESDELEQEGRDWRSEIP